LVIISTNYTTQASFVKEARRWKRKLLTFCVRLYACIICIKLRHPVTMGVPKFEAFLTYLSPICHL
ncbi:MAG: hypothetical protein RMK30_10565, partial [Anaerolineae bacterium]|nr:hypothetical protein [Anaerolineae bacterium]MDW8103300.1 hypothetical protein [Anaerolineae bacterium]